MSAAEARGHGIGLDIGASKTLGVRTDVHGVVVAQVRVPTRPGPDGVLSTAVEVVERLRVEDGPLWPIGIGVPGIVDPDEGAVKHAVNLDLDGAWLPLRDHLESRLQHPVLVENDVNTAALGAAATLEDGLPVDLAYLTRLVDFCSTRVFVCAALRILSVSGAFTLTEAGVSTGLKGKLM